MKLWIARCKDNFLFGFNEKPRLYKQKYCPAFWSTKNGASVEFDNQLFPEVTFENSPKQIEIKLID